MASHVVIFFFRCYYSVSFAEAAKCGALTHISGRMTDQGKVLQYFRHHAVILGKGIEFLAKIRSWTQNNKNFLKAEDYKAELDFLDAHKDEVVVVETDGSGPHLNTLREFWETHADNVVVEHDVKQQQSVLEAVTFILSSFVIRRAVCDQKCATAPVKVEKLRNKRDEVYDLFRNNCEHFATAVVTGHANSKQMEGLHKIFGEEGLNALVGTVNPLPCIQMQCADL